MRSWEDRKEKKSFIRVTAPPRDAGKAFLKEGYVFKAYIPTRRENKPVTFPPSLMLQPWMGSDFTRDDLVRESSMEDDYTHRIAGFETDDKGRELVKIEFTPKPDVPVVWGKILGSVRAGTRSAGSASARWRPWTAARYPPSGRWRTSRTRARGPSSR